MIALAFTGTVVRPAVRRPTAATQKDVFIVVEVGIGFAALGHSDYPKVGMREKESVILVRCYAISRR